LKEPAINRINYILTDKPEHERARRLHEFRPAKGKKIVQAYAEYQRIIAPADDEYHRIIDPAYAEYHRIIDPADAEYQRILRLRRLRLLRRIIDPAYAEYHRISDQAYANSGLSALHLADVPDTTWDGKTIFGGE
jgi:hypothetical protein